MPPGCTTKYFRIASQTGNPISHNGGALHSGCSSMLPPGATIQLVGKRVRQRNKHRTAEEHCKTGAAACCLRRLSEGQGAAPLGTPIVLRTVILDRKEDIESCWNVVFLHEALYMLNCRPARRSVWMKLKMWN
jgi:hypothetical protein